MRRMNPKPRQFRRRGMLGRLRVAAPWALVPILIAASFYGAARSPIGERLWSRSAAAFADIGSALGLRVADIEVEGRRTTEPREILNALAARRGSPILGIDLAAARARLEALPWVRSAVIERRLPDTIFIRLVERQPLALWQHQGKIELIDRDGKVIPAKRLDRFSKLPLVVGEDAASHAAALLAMLATEPALAPHVTAAIWVGDRRWNLSMDNGVDVLLPEKGAAEAWGELARLERQDAILRRDVEAIDMRLKDRLVLRVASPPATAGKDDKKKAAKRT